MGIPMGTNFAPHLANIHLHVYEYKYLQTLIMEGKLCEAKKLSNVYRCQDDCIAIYDHHMFTIHAQGDDFERTPTSQQTKVLLYA